MIRDSEITPDRVSLYMLKSFKNHTRTQYRRRYVNSFHIKSTWLKRLIAWFWYHFGA